MKLGYRFLESFGVLMPMSSHYKEVSVEAMHSTANTRASADERGFINFGAVHGDLSLMGTEETPAKTTPDSEERTRVLQLNKTAPARLMAPRGHSCLHN